MKDSCLILLRVLCPMCFAILFSYAGDNLVMGGQLYHDILDFDGHSTYVTAVRRGRTSLPAIFIVF